MVYKYQELAAVLRAQIRAGSLPAEQQWPSIRLLSQLSGGQAAGNQYCSWCGI